ncbi:MAG: hypothetical protein EOO41_03075 [Methanobacteriota archaeon]|nr:MAG: hypothetical protein EOO41_03075 [Euryarchaeota archaeon]
MARAARLGASRTLLAPFHRPSSRLLPAQVPVLTSEVSRSATERGARLVRYRGMVQDMPEPEWFIPVQQLSTAGE